MVTGHRNNRTKSKIEQHHPRQILDYLLCHSLGKQLTVNTAAALGLSLTQHAVAPECQRQGVGSVLVRFAEKFARDRGYTEIMAHARESALGFYIRLGYVPVGPRFTELGLPHVEVRKRLA